MSDETLSQAPRCALASAGSHGPVAAASPFWWDGGGLWTPGVPATEVLTQLRARPAAAVYVPSLGPTSAVVVRGQTRVYGLHDPVGLATHGPAIAMALSGLALKQAPAILDLARDLPHVVTNRWPAGFVVARVHADSIETVTPPAPPDGIGPALPSVVPSSVRRALAGLRQIVVVTSERELALTPATWSSGMRLHGLGDWPDDVSAAVVVDDGWVGVALEGRIRNGCLTADHVRWWQGLVVGEAAVPRQSAGGIRLPD